MNLQKSFGTLLLGGALAVSSQLLAIKPAHADLLAQYNFDASNGANSAPSYPGLTVSNFTNGAGLAGKTNNSTITATGTGRSRAVTYGNLTPTSKAGAISGQTYYTFTLTPTVVPGNRNGVKFDNLKFTTDVGTGPSTAVGSYFVQANFGANGGFVDVGTTIDQPGRVAGTSPNFIGRTIDLSSFVSPNDNGFFTRPIEFRIYEYDNGTGGTGGGLRIDDVQLNGAVAPVPELSTGLLVALSLGGMCFIGMRRKKGTSPSMNMAF